MSGVGRKLLICFGLLILCTRCSRVDEGKTEDFSYELTVEGSEGGEFVVSYGSESYTVGSESPMVLLIPEGVKVKVSAIPEKGYITEDISVSDIDGNAIECVEDADSVSFEMSGGRLVEGSFTRIEEGSSEEDDIISELEDRDAPNNMATD